MLPLRGEEAPGEVGLDGNTLVERALSLKAGLPLVAFVALTTDTLRSEHNGIANLMRGMFSRFRNPTAHEPKGCVQSQRGGCVGLLSLASLLHRRLDAAVRTTSFESGS
jgi:uncharacterized protein (TIGR02391 family)